VSLVSAEEAGGTYPDLSTAPDSVTVDRVRTARFVRRLVLTLLVAFLALGAAGVLGVRTGSVRATGNGYELAVTYARVTRPGLATPWSAEIRRTGGFEGPVTLAVSSRYFEMFDENGLDPDPAEATATDEEILWEFSPPDGDVLTVSFDARLEPGVQWGKRGTAAVVVDGERMVSVRYRTWVLP
jgi:hypothetical protein